MKQINPTEITTLVQCYKLFRDPFWIYEVATKLRTRKTITVDLKKK